MARKEWDEIILDDNARLFGVVGYSTNDTAFTALICEMQHLGMAVRGTTVDHGSNSQELSRRFEMIGYSQDEGLYARLLAEYRKRTPKTI